jgi:hypothetical protein
MGRLTQRLISALPWASAAAPFICIGVRGFPGGDDWRLELARVAAYSHAWADAQWPPFWAPDLYAGFGSPIFLFYGHVAVALASLCALLVGSYAVALLLALALASGLGVRSMQLTAASAFPSSASRSAARVAVYVFLLNPYVLCDLLLRNAAAEYIALCTVPLALYGVWLRDAGWRVRACWIALGLALTIAAHALSALWACLLVPLLAASAPRPHDDRLGLRLLGVSGIVALALTGYAWLPVLAFKASIQTADLLTGKFAFREQFQELSSLFDGSSRVSAGPLPLAAACAALASIVSRAWRARGAAPESEARGPLSGLLGMFVLFVCLQTSWALPFWERVPALAYFQFPWRFMGPVALLAGLLAAGAFAQLTDSLSERRQLQLELLVWCVCVVGALPQLLRMHAEAWPDVARYEQMLDAATMPKLRFTATARDEYLPPGSHEQSLRGPASERPILAASDGMRIAIRANEPRAITLEVRAESNAELCLARWAFPAWQIRVDDRMQSASACRGGFLRVRVPGGRHRIVASLPVPDARRWGLLLSAVGLLGWLALKRRSTV